MTTPTLLPCPFCGSSDVSYHAETLYSFVVCGKCEAEGPAISCDETGAMEQAASAWNQRSAWQPLPSTPPITPSAPRPEAPPPAWWPADRAPVLTGTAPTWWTR